MSYVSCKYCSLLHKRGEVCPNKPLSNYKKDTTANRFRNSRVWRKKAEAIKRRDNYLCQCCLRQLHNTIRQYNYDVLSVHHVIPIAKDESKKIDDSNLITLCRYHHEEAEKGSISIDILLKVTKEQNNK